MLSVSEKHDIEVLHILFSGNDVMSCRCMDYRATILLTLC